MNRFEKKNTLLIKAFGEYMRQHPEVMDAIADEALLVMQVEGDESFNKWSLRIAQPEKGQRVVYVKLRMKNEKRLRTAIEKLEMQTAE